MTDSVFPTNLDSFANPTDPAGGQYTWEDGSIRNSTADTGAVITPANPALVHEYQHSLANDAIAALQTKVGIDGSADTNSLDYKIAHGGGGGVSSVTGLNTDNTDPANPVVQISVDGSSITGSGTPADPLVAPGGGSGSVTTVSVVTANGFAGTVANASTTPAITISTGITGIPVGDGTGLSASSVTNDVQTKAAIVPNTAPSAGQILAGNAGGTAYAPVTMSSDATLASTGAITIANNAITTAKINAAAVTYAKIQNVSAVSLLGNPTGSGAAPSEITLGSGLSFSGTTLVSSGGGGGSPGGSTKQVQFNDSSSFGGATGFEYQVGASPNVLIQAQNAAYIALVVKGHSSQSANLQEWQNSSATVGAHITAAMEFSNAPTTDSEVFGAGQSYGSGTQSVVIGKAATTSGSSAPYCIAIGYGATISGDTGGGGSIVIGGNTSFAGSNGTIIGNSVTAGAGNGVCVFGQGNSLNGGASLAIGLNSNASNFQARTIGVSNTSAFISTTLIGAGLTATRRNETVFGDDANSSGTGGWTGGQRIREMGAADDSNAYDMGCFTWTWTAATAGTQVSRVGVSTFYHATEQEGFAVQSFSDQARTAVGGTVISGQRQTIYTGVAADIGQVIQGASSQSGDLLQLQKSDGTVYTSVNFTGVVNKYKSVATAGYGVPAIYGFGRSTAQTAAVASVATYTVGAADGSFLISANVLITTATLHSFTAIVTYTDEGNTSRTVTLNFSTLAGALTPTIANAGGASPYEGVPLHIRCKASTSITIATTGTFTTVTYNVEGSITQIA